MLSLEQKSVLLKNSHGRGHAQRKAVVVDEHGVTYQNGLDIQHSRQVNSDQLGVMSCRWRQAPGAARDAPGLTRDGSRIRLRAGRPGCQSSGVGEREFADDADRAVIGRSRFGVIDLVVDPTVELKEVRIPAAV